MQVFTHILYTEKEETIIMETVNLNIRIDKQLRKDLQIIAKQQDTTVTAILTDYIEEYVKENK